MKKQRRYTNDKLGQIAQRQVGLWLEAADLNATEPNPDRDGWDYHVSFPRSAPLDGSNFFDSDPPRASLFIQVKASVTSRRRHRVALSHWAYAAKMPMPWCFVVVEFDEPPVPARLFVVHVDADLVGDVMKRLRKEGAKRRAEQVPKLHKLTMDLVWTEAHQVPCSGVGLREALTAHAGHDMEAYSEQKRHWREGAGIDTIRNELTLTFNGPRGQSDQRIADWALGRVESIQVDQLRRVEHRWGIARAFNPEPNVLLSFSAPPSIGKTLVRIRDLDETEHAEFEANVYCNVRFAPFLPRELWAIRLTWTFLEILMRAASPGIAIRLHIPEKQPAVALSDLATVARAIRLLMKPCKLAYGIPGYDDGRERVDILSSTSEAPDGIEMLAAAEAAWAMCTLFGLPPGFKITPATLDSVAEEIIEYGLMLTSNHVTAQLETLDQTGLLDGGNAVFLWLPSVRLGDYQLIAAMAVEGLVEFVGGRGRVTAKPTFVRKWAIARGTMRAWLRADMPRLVEQVVSELEAEGKKPFVIDSELAALLREHRGNADSLLTGS